MTWEGRIPSLKFQRIFRSYSRWKWKSRVYLARIDDLPIGKGYGELNKWDMALETGFIDGLIRKGLTIAEKLDHVSPRDKSEFIAPAQKMRSICMVLIFMTQV